MDVYVIHPYFNVKMATFVFCEGDIMIIIGFTIDDDFAVGGRCDNWVGSLFGWREAGWNLQTLPFSPSRDTALIIAALPRGACCNKIPIEPFLFAASLSFSTHSEIIVVTMH